MNTKHYRAAPNAAQTGTTHTKVRTGTIAVVGLGYVGLPLAILASSRGYRVLGYDTDQDKIAALTLRQANFLSEHEAAAFKVSGMQLRSSEAVLEGADTYIICVPTPVFEDHTPDLGPLESASRAVARHLKKGALVVVESTVNPGACEEVTLKILQEESGLIPEKDFYFAHCPERINPGDSKYTVRNLPRVIGGYGPESLKRAKELYESIIEAPIMPMGSLKEAEAVKMVENSYRDINIAFVNELAMSFDRAGIDIVNVIRGAATKPFGFTPHFPGAGVGGHCIPVDPYYLIRYGHKNGFVHRFLITAREINNHMPSFTVDLLLRTLRKKKIRPLGSKIALLGLAYKRDVPDLRESPALKIRDELEHIGVQVASFDPFALHASSAKSLDDALEGAAAILIVTDHSAFRSLTPQYLKDKGIRVIIDGRNCLPKEEFITAGIAYQGIGR